MAGGHALGLSLLGLGPALVSLVLLGRRPVLLILVLASAVGWLAALFVAAAPLAAWATPAVVGSPTVAALAAWALLLQELARPRFLRVLAAVMDRLDEHAASSGLRLLSPADRVQVAAAAGLGHALAHVAALFAGLVPFAAGGATAYTAKCAAVDLFTASAWLCLAWTVIHTAAMVVAAAGLRSKKAAQRWMAPLAHTLGVAASCISLVDGGCLVAIALQLLIAAAVAAHALLVAARAAQSGARFV